MANFSLHRLSDHLHSRGDEARWCLSVAALMTVAAVAWNSGTWNIRSWECRLLLTWLTAAGAIFISYRFARPAGTQDLKALVAVMALSIYYSNTILLLVVLVLSMRWSYVSRWLAQFLLVPTIIAIVGHACGPLASICDLYGNNDFDRSNQVLVQQIDGVHAIYTKLKSPNNPRRVYNLVREIQVLPGLSIVKVVQRKVNLPEKIVVSTGKNGEFSMNGGREAVVYLDDI